MLSFSLIINHLVCLCSSGVKIILQDLGVFMRSLDRIPHILLLTKKNKYTIEKKTLIKIISIYSTSSLY